MIISKEGKLFGKVSIIDVIIIALLIALVVFCAKKFSQKSAPSASQYTTVVMEFTQYDAPKYVFDNIKSGDVCTEAAKATSMGKVASTSKSESVIYNTNADGKTVVSSRDDACTVVIKIEGNGYIQNNGGIYIDGTAYYIGKTYEIRAGDTALSGKITAAYNKES